MRIVVWKKPLSYFIVTKFNMTPQVKYYYRCIFSDGNSCCLIFEVINNRIKLTRKWKNVGANCESIKNEIYDWEEECAAHFSEEVLRHYKTFLDENEKIILVPKDE